MAKKGGGEKGERETSVDLLYGVWTVGGLGQIVGCWSMKTVRGALVRSLGDGEFPMRGCLIAI